MAIAMQAATLSGDVESLRLALAHADEALCAARRALSATEAFRADVAARLDFAMNSQSITAAGGNVVDQEGAILQ